MNMRKGEVTVAVIILGLLLTIVANMAYSDISEEKSDTNTTKSVSK